MAVTSLINTTLNDSRTTIIQDSADNADQNLIFTNDKLINGVYVAIGSLGIAANGFVLFVFTASKQMRRFKHLTNIYILNQSMLDFLGAVFLVFLTLFEYKQEDRLNGVGGELYCRLWLSKLPLWSIFVSSTFNLVVINIERYIGIRHSLWHKVHYGGITIKITIVCIWCIGPIYNGGYMITTSYIEDGQCFYLKSWSPLAQRFVGFLTVIIQFFIPIAIHAFCLIGIVRFLHRRANAIDDSGGVPMETTATAMPPVEQVNTATVVSNGQNGAQNGGTNKKSKKKRDEAIRVRNQVLRTLALMTLCFILCWIWNQVFFLLFNLGFAVSFQGVFYHFTVVAVYVNCFTNPFIYMWKYKNFRDAAKGIFMKWKRRNSGQTQITYVGEATTTRI